MKMGQKRSKSFGAEFSVVRDDTVVGQGIFSAFSKTILIILSKSMTTFGILFDHPNSYSCITVLEKSVLLLNTRSD